MQMRARTVGMERLPDETGDMASLSDIVCERSPAEIKMPEASPKLVIDLWREFNEWQDGCVQGHRPGRGRRRGKKARQGRQD